jgi:hypothetical protein
MMRRTVIAALVLLVAGVTYAGGTKEVTGTVKVVSGNTFTVTDSAAKDWAFGVSKETLVLVKGGHHKMDKLKADGKPTTIDEFISEKQNVIVKYTDEAGKLTAKEVQVKQ